MIFQYFLQKDHQIWKYQSDSKITKLDCQIKMSKLTRPKWKSNCEASGGAFWRAEGPSLAGRMGLLTQARLCRAGLRPAPQGLMR